MTRRLTLLLILLLAFGCAPAADPSVTPSEFTAVLWVRDSTGHWFLFDTGSPRSMIRPSVVGLPAGTFGEYQLPNFKVTGIPDVLPPLLVTEALPARLLQVEARGEVEPLGGVIGADILETFRFAIDPREPFLRLNDPPGTRYSDTEPLSLDVELRGGGRTCADERCWDFSATRLVVPINIGGVETHALVDTAATYVTVSRTLVPRLEEAGPVSQLIFDTRSGPAQESLARVAHISVGTIDGDAAQLPQVPLLVGDPAVMDPALSRLHVETGRRVEVLLGHSFLRRFVTEIDMSSCASIKLHAIEPQELELDDFESFGFFASVSEECWDVTAVVRDSTIARDGLVAGDCIVAIDDVPRTDMTETEALADELLAGDAVTLTVRRSDGDQTFVVGRDDHLPPTR